MGDDLRVPRMANVLDLDDEYEIEGVAHFAGPVVEQFEEHLAREIHGQLQLEADSQLVEEVVDDDQEAVDGIAALPL